MRIAHIVFRFDYGGLENGLVNLVNTMDPSVGRHTIIALTGVTAIAERLLPGRAEVVALGKKPGQDPAAYWRLYRLLRRIRPHVVHTRNVGTLDCQLVAWLAGVPIRVHGEHGWDTHDPFGRRRRYRLMRRALFPLVHTVIPLSQELERWLVDTVGVGAGKLERICNGVDCERFRPEPSARESGVITFGSVTRFSEIKDPLNVLRAFERLRALRPEAPVRLLMVGDGALLPEARAFVEGAGLGDAVTFAGEALDVRPWLARMDLFVLGSRREGISNTILEAMAMGLPVIATAVGGNGELIADGETGCLVPAGDANALAEAMARYVDDPAMARRHGCGARQRAVQTFSLPAMAGRYAGVYQALRSTHLPEAA
jgi:sugar transferase (PEP-CTERM/EpsH1 system associated)